ncbi:MAG: DUF86 domain-containing protein [bacterium]
MTKIIKEQFDDKVDNLVKIYDGLKKLQRLKLNDFKENIENVWAVTFGVVAGVEAILDISQYILSSKGIKAESYGSIPERLLKAKIINKEFSEKLRDMVGFRNRAIHNYPSLNEELLYNVLQNDVDDFKKFLKIAKQYEKFNRAM